MDKQEVVDKNPKAPESLPSILHSSAERWALSQDHDNVVIVHAATIGEPLRWQSKKPCEFKVEITRKIFRDLKEKPEGFAP